MKKTKDGCGVMRLHGSVMKGWQCLFIQKSNLVCQQEINGNNGEIMVK